MPSTWRSTQLTVVAAKSSATMVHRYPNPGGRTAGAAPLSPDPATVVAADQRLDLGHAHPVEVARDGVLETAGRRGEFQRAGVVGPGQETVDQARGEGVTGADPVHDVGDVIAAAFQEFPAVVQAGGPAVPVGAPALAEGDGLALQVGELPHDPLDEGAVRRGLEPPARHIHLGGDAERVLAVDRKSV